MRKILSFILILLLILGLYGCNSKEKEISKEKKPSESNTVEETKTVKETKTVGNLIIETKTPKVETLDNSKVTKKENNKEKVLENPPYNKRIVVIDPGHGLGSNTEKEPEAPNSDVMKIKDGGGAQGVNTKIPEYIITMQVGLKLKILLEEKGINVIMTKEDAYTSLGNIDRAYVGNSNDADLVIRIHCDSAEASSANGASMLVPASVGYAKDISDVSKTYGEVILNNLVSTVGMYNRGVIERSDLTGFNWSEVPVVLVEMGFLSNPEEDNLLISENYQNKLAEGLCKGILEALEE